MEQILLQPLCLILGVSSPIILLLIILIIVLIFRG